MPDGKVCPEQFRGWLQKWTNYIKGYQKRWFVLSNGTLSYYRYVECIKSSVLGRYSVFRVPSTALAVYWPCSLPYMYGCGYFAERNRTLGKHGTAIQVLTAVSEHHKLCIT